MECKEVVRVELERNLSVGEQKVAGFPLWWLLSSLGTAN